jgi:hypothetical protein
LRFRRGPRYDAEVDARRVRLRADRLAAIRKRCLAVADANVGRLSRGRGRWHLGRFASRERPLHTGGPTIKITKRGFAWLAQYLNLKAGDTRTIHADPEPAPTDPNKPKIIGLQ